MKTSFLKGLLVSLALATTMTAGAKAQQFPEKQHVTIVVPYLQGGGNDILARLVSQYLSEQIGQSVVVENRPGAGSLIGIESVAKAEPDGYTLVWTPSDGISISPAVRATMPYQVPDDFEFVARMVELPTAVGVHPSLPIHDLEDLIAYAKENPGRLRYGSPGVGGSGHMSAVLIEQTAGIEMTHVPYGGVSAAITDMLGGHIEVAMVTPQTLKPHHDAGNIRVISMTSPERHPLYPDVKTLRESGLDIAPMLWYGILAPAGVPEETLERLRAELETLLENPEVAGRFNELGYEIAFLTGDEFRDYVVADLEQWRQVAETSGITVED